MKVLYVTTISNTVNSFLIPHIRTLKENGYQVDIVTHLIQEINDELIKLWCEIYNVQFSRNPLSIDNIDAYKKTKEIIEKGEYDTVYTHTPIASAIVRFACKSNKNIKVIYTAHGFHFFKGALLKNWIIYYPVEKYLSKYTDVLITINREGLPVSLMEAMAAQLPIICSDIIGNNDLIKHNENGNLINPDDVEGFKDSIAIIHNNSQIKKKFKEKNSEIFERFRIESVLKYMIDIYNQEVK